MKRGNKEIPEGFNVKGTRKVLQRVELERYHQHRKFGNQNHLSDLTWGHILMEEVGEACKAVLKNRGIELRDEVNQVAAVAVAWAESLEERGVKRLYEEGVRVSPDGYEDNYE